MLDCNVASTVNALEAEVPLRLGTDRAEYYVRIAKADALSRILEGGFPAVKAGCYRMVWS